MLSSAKAFDSPLRSARKASEMPLSDYLEIQRGKVDRALSDWFGAQEKVVEAMRYSLLLPSKRLRPLFCLETCRALCGAEERAIPAAMALEMVHSYSLIHDDLPAMDNDDLRRGKPTNHKVYGEALAILAGDGLLTSSFETLATAGEVSASIRLNWIKELSKASGIEGMVLGQAWDLVQSTAPGAGIRSVEDLEKLHRAKTGALLCASVVMGGIAASASLEVQACLRTFAGDMGLAFQIQDDVLDVIGGEKIGKPVRSDERNDKVTYVSLLGLEGAKRHAQKWTEKALQALESLSFPFENRLKDLTGFVISREL